MAYAELAGLPAITGLYTTVVCLVAYALVGPSPILVLGPDSSLGPMIAATILPLAAGNQEQAIALAGMLALLVGLVITWAPGSASSASSPTCCRTRFGPDTSPASRSSSSSASCRSCSGSRPTPSGLIAEAGAFAPRRAGRPDEPLGAGHRAAEPGASSWASSACRRGRRASWSRSSSAIGLSIVLDLAAHASRSSACCPRVSRCRPSQRSMRRTSRSCSRPRWASRWSPSATRSPRRAASRPAPATRWTATRSSPASAPPTSPPVSSPASRSAPAAPGRPWPSSRGRRRSSPGWSLRRSCC